VTSTMGIFFRTFDILGMRTGRNRPLNNSKLATGPKQVSVPKGVALTP
jgi:hypothetical protein